MSENPSNFESRAPINLVIQTAGEILDDGTIIELVENPSQPDALALLKFDGNEREIGSHIEHEGALYVPLLIPSTVRRAFRVPSGYAPTGSTAQLFARLLSVLENLTDLSEHARKLVVAFIFSSWIPDLLVAPVTLFLWSPDPTAGARVLTVLSSLCRLALALSGADARDLTTLPDDLPTTLLLFRPASGRRNCESLAALGWRGFRSCRRGRLVQTVGAKAIANDTPLLDDRALGPTFVAHVAITRRLLPPLDRKTLDALAKEFLPQLLRYRLLRCQTVAGEESAQVCPASASSSLSALEMCFRDEPALMETVTPLIEGAADGHETGRIDPRVPLLQVLRTRCHEEGRDRLYVAEIALDLNAQILANGGKVELTSRMVGSLLRSLGWLRISSTGTGAA